MNAASRLDNAGVLQQSVSTLIQHEKVSIVSSVWEYLVPAAIDDGLQGITTHFFFFANLQVFTKRR